MKKLKFTALSLALVLAAVVLVAPEAVMALNPADQIQSGVDSAGGTGQPTLGAQIQTVVNILLFILGAIAVVMIVIGGIRFATSNGDSSTVKAAKDTILYAVVGLIVAIIAYAIVNFVVDAF